MLLSTSGQISQALTKELLLKLGINWVTLNNFLLLTFKYHASIREVLIERSKQA